jgi:hypothetical protein
MLDGSIEEMRSDERSVYEIKILFLEFIEMIPSVRNSQPEQLLLNIQAPHSLPY